MYGGPNMRERRGKMSNSNSDRESRPPKATTIRAHVLLFVFKCPFQTHLSLWPLLLITFQKNPQLFHICFLLFALLFYFLEAMSTLALGKRKPPWLKLSCDYNQNTAVMRFVFSEALTDGINYGLPLTAFYDYEVSA